MLNPSEQLIEALMSAIIAFVQLVLLRFHIALPATIQEALDNKVAGGGMPKPPIGPTEAPPAAPEHQDCFPWKGLETLAVQKQTHQELPPGAETTTWWNDCGETCCSMIIRAARGVYCPPDVLRMQSLGVASNGLTGVYNVQDILSHNYVRSEIRYWDSTEYAHKLAAATADGRPVMALGRWPTPGGVLHWLLVTSVGGGQVRYINPWGGVRSWIDLADWHLYSSDQYIEVTDHMLFDSEEDMPF